MFSSHGVVFLCPVFFLCLLQFPPLISPVYSDHLISPRRAFEFIRNLSLEFPIVDLSTNHGNGQDDTCSTKHSTLEVVKRYTRQRQE